MPELSVSLPTLGGKQLWADRTVYAGWRVQRNVVTSHHRLLDPRRNAHAWGTFDECVAALQRRRQRGELRRVSEHVVILLHGIFRAAEAWRPMERALAAAGYDPAPVTYPSTWRGIELHADQVEEVLDRLDDAATVSFVTHSMGGLVAREVLGREASWRDRLRVNRLVMIGTPNRGAQIADLLAPLVAFRRLAGPAATQLTSDYVPELALPSCPFAVIAGARGDERGFNPLLSGDDDMTVSVASALLDGAEDRWVVPGAVHTTIMRRKDVIEGTVRYLGTGSLREVSEATC